MICWIKRQRSAHEQDNWLRGGLNGFVRLRLAVEMRVAFFVLLLVNIAFLAWAGWIDAAPRAAGARSNSNISTLMLASEMKAASNAAARGPASAAKLETAASPVSCFSVGPFNTLQRSASAATVLQQRGLAPRQREEQGEVWDGYW